MKNKATLLISFFISYACFAQSNNFASGSGALGNLTTGSDNTAIGIKALSSNTIGSSNTASGAYTLNANTTGVDNTATGRAALYSNTTGSSNTATGRGALAGNTTGSSNTANGVYALNLNITGSDNTAVGRSALSENTSGSGNTAIGRGALLVNTTGYENTAIGTRAGANNATGSGNVFLGYQAGMHESGSNMLYVSNSDTAQPLIKGNFATKQLDLNGDVNIANDLTIGGTITAGEYLDANGNRIIGVDSTTGRTIFSSSMGKLQMGKQSSDATYFVGNVHVPKPSAPDHAATRSYVDASSATAAAMDTRLPAGDKKFRVSIGQATKKGQSATALNFVGIKSLESGKVIDFSTSVGSSSYSGSIGRVSVGVSW